MQSEASCRGFETLQWRVCDHCVATGVEWARGRKRRLANQHSRYGINKNMQDTKERKWNADESRKCGLTSITYFLMLAWNKKPSSLFNTSLGLKQSSPSTGKRRKEGACTQPLACGEWYFFSYKLFDFCGRRFLATDRGRTGFFLGGIKQN